MANSFPSGAGQSSIPGYWNDRMYPAGSSVPPAHLPQNGGFANPASHGPSFPVYGSGPTSWPSTMAGTATASHPQYPINGTNFQTGYLSGPSYMPGTSNRFHPPQQPPSSYPHIYGSGIQFPPHPDTWPSMQQGYSVPQFANGFYSNDPAYVNPGLQQGPSHFPFRPSGPNPFGSNIQYTHGPGNMAPDMHHLPNYHADSSMSYQNVPSQFPMGADIRQSNYPDQAGADLTSRLNPYASNGGMASTIPVPQNLKTVKERNSEMKNRCMDADVGMPLRDRGPRQHLADGDRDDVREVEQKDVEPSRRDFQVRVFGNFSTHLILMFYPQTRAKHAPQL